MKIETFIENEKDKQAILKNLKSTINDFNKKYPNEDVKKEIILKNLNNILDVIGCNINDKTFTLKLIDNKVVLKNVYCDKSIDIADDNAICFFNNVLKLLIDNTKELQSTKDIFNI